MCGRYARFSSPDRFAELFGSDRLADDLEPAPRYNVAPSQRVLAARAGRDGGRELVALKWGLLPAWSKASRFPYSTINARAETVAEKPAFRGAFRHRRCLIAADGFYEWRKTGGPKQPYFITLAGGEPFAFAGLWEHWEAPAGRPPGAAEPGRTGMPRQERGEDAIESCAIVVTAANELMGRIHDRMPVILAPEDYALWLDPVVRDPRLLQSLLRPFPAGRMRMHPIDTAVNSPRNEGPELLAPVPEPDP